MKIEAEIGMNKKIFGIKLSTILTVFICLVISLVVWMLVEYDLNNSKAAFSIPRRWYP